MKTTLDRLEEIKSEGYELDFGNTFNDAFEVYKRTALMSGLALILFFIVAFALAFGGMGIFMSAGNDISYLANISEGDFSIVGRIIYVLATCVIAGLGNPFSASLIRMAALADKGEDVSVGDAFACYKAPYFVPLFVEALIVSFFSIFITTAIQMAFPQDFVMGLVGMGINLLISFVTVMAVPLIIFGNLKPLEAIQGSVMLVFKRPFVIFGLLLVGIIFALLGFIGFCIGVCFTIPIMMAIYYSIYKNSVGIEETAEMDEIGTLDY
ncbi:MAG: hypothetical protein EOO50_12055 [Flavobacterium sp.]|uniref:hypothetical protein n=1 Tax=Flavobacterium sp. TaxID=239 RepID=UPI001218597E|nr:hypothetical protein [Flavobacterium sp.]RZJ65849.1 MAG: hypothetical protein EOO50_12055 [Flavobacterium sp.]